MWFLIQFLITRRSHVQIVPPQPRALRGQTSKRPFFLQLQRARCLLPSSVNCRVSGFFPSWEQIRNKISADGFFHDQRSFAFALLRNVGIPVSGCADVRVAQKFLSEFEIARSFIENARRRMPESVKSRFAGSVDCFRRPDRLLLRLQMGLWLLRMYDSPFRNRDMTGLHRAGGNYRHELFRQSAQQPRLQWRPLPVLINTPFRDAVCWPRGSEIRTVL
jgi:hypothetical protein